MKALFIGGTGNISTSVSRMAVEQGVELYLLNRGTREVYIPGAHSIVGDINAPDAVAKALDGHTFDVVVNWIAYTVEDIERDLALFAGNTAQYIFISSASVYQKPPTSPFITESTPLCNPYWDYSRRKIACEERLMQAHRENGFPMTIVRPSHTYDIVFPVSIGGWNDYTLVDRMKRGEKIIVHGDGTSLWTVTHAEDFARGFVGLMANPRALGHAFHITSDESLTWNQIYETIAQAAGIEAKIVHIPSDFLISVEPGMEGGLLGDKSWSVIFDNTKIKTFVPSFKAVIPFHVGIRRTLDWFHADPARRRIIPGINQQIDRFITAYEGKE